MSWEKAAALLKKQQKKTPKKKDSSGSARDFAKKFRSGFNKESDDENRKRRELEYADRLKNQ